LTKELVFQLPFLFARSSLASGYVALHNRLASQKDAFQKMKVPALKLVLLGNSGVGKSAIGRRFTSDTFSAEGVSTIGADTMRTRITVRSQVVDLAIWDTAGQEVYRALTPQYFRDASLAVIVFSVTDGESLNGADYWLTTVNEATPSALRTLVGNKIDVTPRNVTFDNASALAEKHNVPYMETSAMTGQGVASVFEELVQLYIDQKAEAFQAERPPDEPQTAVVLTPVNASGKKKKCC
jgi:Ras-related protein Rab-18